MTAVVLAIIRKAAPVGNRPGLHLETITDKQGHTTRRWKRAGDSLSVGDHVHDGSKHGAGRVTDIDEKGVTVERAGGAKTHHPAAEADALHRFSPESHGTSSMSDAEVRTLHKHVGKPSGSERHQDIHPTDGMGAYQQAEEALPEFQSKLKQIGGKIGAKTFENDGAGAMAFLHGHPGTPVLMLAPIKGMTRASKKADQELEDSNGKDGWDTIRDLVRGSIVVPKLSDVPNVLKTIKESGLQVTRVKNRFAQDNKGYRDLALNVRTSNGHVCELQVHVAPMILAKEKFGGHSHYEVERDARDAIKRRKDAGRDPNPDDVAAHKHATDSMAALYDKAWRGIRGVV